MSILMSIISRDKCFASVLAASILVATTGLGFADGYQNQLQPLSTGYTTNSYDYATGNFAKTAATQEDIQLRGGISTIPKGTSMLIKLDEPVSSYSTTLGESVTAKLENDLFMNDQIAIPAGSEVVGQVSNVSRSGRLGKHGEIEIKFHTVKTPAGQVLPISGHVVTSDDSGILRGNSYAMDVVKGVGVAAGGTGVGALTGTALGGILGVAGTGAILGTGLGAVAGMTYAIARKGKDVVIPDGARLSVRMAEDIAVNN